MFATVGQSVPAVTPPYTFVTMDLAAAKMALKLTTVTTVLGTSLLPGAGPRPTLRIGTPPF